MKQELIYQHNSICIQTTFAGTQMNNYTILAPTTNTPATVLLNDAKRIDIIISDPLDARLVFTAYKANF